MSHFRKCYNQALSRTDLDPAVLFSDESLVVIAGPGSGKTNILTLKVACVLEKLKNEPRGVACLTFSRRLAKEIKDKLLNVSVLPERNVFIGTIHSFCLANFVSLYANFHEYNISLPIRIASQKECDSYWIQAMRNADVSDSAKSRIISFRNKDYLENRVFQTFPDKELPLQKYVMAIKHYERLLFDNGVLDFDLIIRASIKLVHEHDYIKQAISARFRWLFIDEYQDLGYPLHLLSKILLDSSPIKFFIVGDPDQCIYGFQGATPTYLNEMKLRIESIDLRNNYRSAEVICRAANVMLNKDNKQTVVNKDINGRVYLVNCSGYFQHQCSVGKDIVNTLISCGVNPGKITILTRYRKFDPESHNPHPGILEIKQELGNITAKILSNPFYSDHTAFVSWLQDVADWCSSGYKNGNILFKDLFLDWLDLYECDLFPETEQYRFELQKKLLGVIRSLCGENTLVKELFLKLEHDFYPPDFLEKLGKYRPDDLVQYNEIIDLLKVGGKIENCTVQEFGIKVLSGKEVLINTLHGSKGSQNDIVLIIGADLIINEPSLFYVGLTRAKFATFIFYSGKNPYCQNMIAQLSESSQFKHFSMAPGDEIEIDDHFFTDYQYFLSKLDNDPLV